MQSTVCCFLGHREICITPDLTQQVSAYIHHLITEEGVDTFLFGSKSQFIRLCYQLVTKAKRHYPHIKRVYVRAEFPYINEAYSSYLLGRYEDTYFPETALNARRSVYIKRNQHMIDCSKFCVFFFEPSLVPKGRPSGTALALEYAIKRKKHLALFP